MFLKEWEYKLGFEIVEILNKKGVYQLDYFKFVKVVSKYCFKKSEEKS